MVSRDGLLLFSSRAAVSQADSASESARMGTEKLEIHRSYSGQTRTTVLPGRMPLKFQDRPEGTSFRDYGRWAIVVSPGRRHWHPSRLLQSRDARCFDGGPKSGRD